METEGDAKSSARQLLEDLARFAPIDPPRVVWSSPAVRCRSVAAELAQRLGAPLAVDEALHELDFGAWEGRTWRAIAEDDRDRYERWASAWKTEAPPAGETLGALEARVLRWARALDASCTHLLIGHAGPVRALRVAREALTWDAAMAEAVPHLAWRAL